MPPHTAHSLLLVASVVHPARQVPLGVGVQDAGGKGEHICVLEIIYRKVLLKREISNVVKTRYY